MTRYIFDTDPRNDLTLPDGTQVFGGQLFEYDFEPGAAESLSFAGVRSLDPSDDNDDSDDEGSAGVVANVVTPPERWNHAVDGIAFPIRDFPDDRKEREENPRIEIESDGSDAPVIQECIDGRMPCSERANSALGEFFQDS